MWPDYSTSAAEHALSIPEITATIIHWSQYPSQWGIFETGYYSRGQKNKDLLQLALVNKMWSHEALRCLWGVRENVQKNRILSLDMDRRQYYADFIQEIELETSKNPYPFRDLTFPRLRELKLRVNLDKTRSYAPRLANTRINHLLLCYTRSQRGESTSLFENRHHHVMAIVEQLAETYPLVRSMISQLRWSGRKMPREMLNRFPKLEEFTARNFLQQKQGLVMFPPDSTQHPNLKKLKLEISTRPLHMIDSSSAYQMPLFPRLTHLDVGLINYDEIMAFLNLEIRLRVLHCEARVSEAALHLLPISKIPSCSFVEELSLRIKVLNSPLAEPILSGSSLASLAHTTMAHARIFEVLVEFDDDYDGVEPMLVVDEDPIDDTTVRHIAECAHRLERLEIKTVGIAVEVSSSEDSVAILRKSSPSLEEVTIAGVLLSDQFENVVLRKDPHLYQL